MNQATATEEDFSSLTLASGIMNDIAVQNERQDFSDIIITVDGTDFHSHKFVLSACSGFFRGLFVSGMKETVEGRVKVFDISSNIFAEILNCIFSGRSILTVDNMIDVWHAATQLDISFLLKHTEDFLSRNISSETCLDIYDNARLLECGHITRQSWAFILNNFETLIESNEILAMSESDVMTLLDSDDLKVTSEDHVVEFLLRWSNEEAHRVHANNSSAHQSSVLAEGKTAMDMGRYTTEEKTRLSLLPKLLSRLRYCLLSGRAIESLLQTSLYSDTVMALIKESIQYQLEPDRRHDYCPLAACHRFQSSFTNVVVCLLANGTNSTLMCRDKTGKYFRLAPDKVFGNTQYGLSMASYGDFVYIMNFDTIFQYSCLQNKVFEFERTRTRNGDQVVITRDSLYIVGNGTPNIERADIRLKSSLKPVGKLPATVTSVAAVIHDKNIIVLGSKEGVTNVTTMQCFNIKSAESYLLDDIEEPPLKAATFKKADRTFILFRSGALWTVETATTGRLTVRYETLLWDFNRPLRGAVLCRDELLIFGDKMPREIEDKWIISVPGVFSCVKNIIDDGDNYLNAVIPRTSLTMGQ